MVSLSWSCLSGQACLSLEAALPGCQDARTEWTMSLAMAVRGEELEGEELEGFALSVFVVF